MFKRFSLVLVLAMIAAACGASETVDDPTGTTAANGGTETTTGSGAGDEVAITILAEDIPAGLDYDGPSAAIPTSQTGMVNLQENLVYYESAGTNDEGVGILDFNSFEGRLAESWEYDESTLTWTFNLRPGRGGLQR